jgi:hypothetical protein
MKILVHVCFADAEPRCPACVLLPGGLVAQCWWVLEPTDEPSIASSGTVGTHDRIVRNELPQPGITYECNSMEEAAEVLTREMNDVAYLM